MTLGFCFLTVSELGFRQTMKALFYLTSCGFRKTVLQFFLLVLSLSVQFSTKTTWQLLCLFLQKNKTKQTKPQKPKPKKNQTKNTQKTKKENPLHIATNVPEISILLYAFRTDKNLCII